MTAPWLEINIPEGGPLAGTFRVKIVDGKIIEAEERRWVPFGRHDLSVVTLLERLRDEALASGQRLKARPSPAKAAASRQNGEHGGRPSAGKGFDWAARQAKAESRVAAPEPGLWRAERFVSADAENPWWPIQGTTSIWSHANRAMAAWRTARAAELRAQKEGE